MHQATIIIQLAPAHLAGDIIAGAFKDLGCHLTAAHGHVVRVGLGHMDLARSPLVRRNV
jgi:hypothetical protein